MGLDFVSGQYGCLFSRCRKYVINSLIHGHFHIGLVIIPRSILFLDSVSGQYGDLGMITRPIWKCPCINLYVLQNNIQQKLRVWENESVSKMISMEPFSDDFKEYFSSSMTMPLSFCLSIFNFISNIIYVWSTSESIVSSDLVIIVNILF